MGRYTKDFDALFLDDAFLLSPFFSERALLSPPSSASLGVAFPLRCQHESGAKSLPVWPTAVGTERCFYIAALCAPPQELERCNGLSLLLLSFGLFLINTGLSIS